MYIWIILDVSPDKCYKKRHVIPGAIIPGPAKPKDLDSFIFPGLYHLSALRNDGLKVWDALQGRIVVKQPVSVLVCADAPAMAYMNGQVGHSGKHHCRHYCKLEGRNKGGSHYYLARLKPNNATQNSEADINLI